MLHDLGVVNFMSNYKTITTCQDKLSFYNHMYDSGLEDLLPKTSDNHRDISFPKICKPRRGSGSRGIELWRSKKRILKTSHQLRIFIIVMNISIKIFTQEQNIL